MPVTCGEAESAGLLMDWFGCVSGLWKALLKMSSGMQNLNKIYAKEIGLKRGSQTRGPHVAHQDILCGPQCFL